MTLTFNTVYDTRQKLETAVHACCGSDPENNSDCPPLDHRWVIETGNLTRLFENQDNVNCRLRLTDWDLSSDELDMSYMFKGATMFTEQNTLRNTGIYDLNNREHDATSSSEEWSGFGVSNAVTMTGMFEGSNFNGEVDWDAFEVVDRSYMFAEATKFNHSSVTKWQTFYCKNMAHMFAGATAFNQDLGKWIVNDVTDVSHMFAGASAFNQDLATWDTKGVTDMSHMFAGATAFNQALGKWNTKEVTDMSHMFAGATTFNQSFLGTTENVKYLSSMFENATNFNGVVENFKTLNVIAVDRMFAGATSFNQAIDKWDLSVVRDMTSMFEDASLFNQRIHWNLPLVENITCLFKNASSFDNGDEAVLVLTNTTELTDMEAVFYGAVSFTKAVQWSVAKVSSFRDLFRGAAKFNNNITLVPTDNLIDVRSAFKDAQEFNQDLSLWNMDNVTWMEDLFFGAVQYNNGGRPLQWNIAHVSSLMNVFKNAKAFDQDVSKWNVTQTVDMTNTFNGAERFNNDGESLAWTTSSLQSMEGIFENATEFNQDVSSFDIVGVTSLARVFKNALKFNQSLAGWNVSRVASLDETFSGAVNFDFSNLFVGEDNELGGNSAISCNNVGITLLDGTTLPCPYPNNPSALSSSSSNAAYTTTEIPTATSAPILGPTPPTPTQGEREPESPGTSGLAEALDGGFPIVPVAAGAAGGVALLIGVVLLVIWMCKRSRPHKEERAVELPDAERGEANEYFMMETAQSVKSKSTSLAVLATEGSVVLIGDSNANSDSEMNSQRGSDSEMNSQRGSDSEMNSQRGSDYDIVVSPPVTTEGIYDEPQVHAVAKIPSDTVYDDADHSRYSDIGEGQGVTPSVGEEDQVYTIADESKYDEADHYSDEGEHTYDNNDGKAAEDIDHIYETTYDNNTETAAEDIDNNIYDTPNHLKED